MAEDRSPQQTSEAPEQRRVVAHRLYQGVRKSLVSLPYPAEAAAAAVVKTTEGPQHRMTSSAVEDPAFHRRRLGENPAVLRPAGQVHVGA